jgi:hypothetical protein
VNAFIKKLSFGLGIFMLAMNQSALACATCYGASDSPLAQGMNMGIMVLLGFIFSVLVGITGFFIFIVRRANTLAATTSPPLSTDSKP